LAALRDGAGIQSAECKSSAADQCLHFGNLRYIEIMDIDATLKALSNPHRRLMLDWLRAPREHFPAPLPEHADLPGACATYVYEKSGLSQATVSQYLGQLESAGLIKRTRHGRWTFFSRDEDAVASALDALKATLGVS
jgi:DNA-binding transcriptional ArsR family regulator